MSSRIFFASSPMKNSGSGVKTLLPPCQTARHSGGGGGSSCNKFDTNRFGFHRRCLDCLSRAAAQAEIFSPSKLSMKEYISGFVRWFLSSPPSGKNNLFPLSSPSLSGDTGVRGIWKRRNEIYIFFPWFLLSFSFRQNSVRPSSHFLSLSFLSIYLIHCRLSLSSSSLERRNRPRFAHAVAKSH